MKVDLRKIENLSYLKYLNSTIWHIVSVHPKVDLALALAGVRKQAVFEFPPMRYVNEETKLSWKSPYGYYHEAYVPKGMECYVTSNGDVISQQEYDKWVKEIEDLGLYVTIGRTYGRTCLPGTEHHEVFVTKYPKFKRLAEKYIQTRDEKIFALVVDYPKCCIRKFFEEEKLSENLRKELQRIRREEFSRMEEMLPELRLVPWGPCRPNCKETLKRAKKFKKVLLEFDSKLYELATRERGWV